MGSASTFDCARISAWPGLAQSRPPHALVRDVAYGRLTVAERMRLHAHVTVDGGRIVSVQPKAAVMPLVAVKMIEAGGKDWRSRPGGRSRQCFAGIAVDGLEDLLGYPRSDQCAVV